MTKNFADTIRNANPVVLYALAVFATIALGAAVMLAWPVIFPFCHFVFDSVAAVFRAVARWIF